MKRVAPNATRVGILNANMAHKSEEEILIEVEKARKSVQVGALYFHYKHPEKYYVVEFVGVLEEAKEPCVAYRALYGKGILWVRTLKAFMEKIEVNGKKVSRFTRV